MKESLEGTSTNKYAKTISAYYMLTHATRKKQMHTSIWHSTFAHTQELANKAMRTPAQARPHMSTRFRSHAHMHTSIDRKCKWGAHVHSDIGGGSPSARPYQLNTSAPPAREVQIQARTFKHTSTCTPVQIQARTFKHTSTCAPVQIHAMHF